MQESSKNSRTPSGRRPSGAARERRLSRQVRMICQTLAVGILLLVAGYIIFRLYDIQIRNGDKYRQLAAQQQLQDTTIKAVRGEIYDTSGITLASTSRVWNIWVDPKDSKVQGG